MRSKIGYGVLGVTVAFLLATNPVVVNAAGFIGSAQIKDNSIKSKDIKNNQVKSIDVKNGSLTAADLAAGTIPAPAAPQVKSVKRWLTSDVNTVLAEAATLSFIGSTTTIAVDGSDTVVASGQADMFGDTVSDDYFFSVCARPVGAVTPPTPIGGATAASNDNDILAGSNAGFTVSRSVSDILAAGSYTVGSCARAETSNAGSISHTLASGWVMVIDGTGALAKAPARGVESNEE